MFVYKRLKASDASITAFEAHKEFNVNKDNTSSLGVSLIDSQYSSASIDTYSQFNPNKELEYFQLNHLFYKDAVFNLGDLNGGINYKDQEKRLYDKATIISISQKNLGSAIQKGTVTFNNLYIDDSKGNLYKSSTNLNNYPVDKDRVFYLGPVEGFKRTDLTRDLYTGVKLVNPPSSYNAKVLDDSLYKNPIEYINCSIEDISALNCTGVQIENGYIKAPHKNDYNFGNEDFTISFYYKTTNAAGGKYIIAKSKSQTSVKTPASNTDGSLKNTHGSSSLLQATEIDAGGAFPFEISIDRKVIFKRADQTVTSTHTSANSSIAGDTLYHIACVKTGSDLKIYIDGVLSNGTGTDNTNNCKNQADLFIGTNPDISQNKLDNTSEGLVSQLMIWNKGLTTTEIQNVSSSIDGSPYVGNVFYENGFLTFTSPSANNGLFSTTTNFNDIILLNPTAYNTIGGGNIDTRDLTFSGSFTFFNEETNIISIDPNSSYSDLVFNSTYVTASLTDSRFGPISMSSQPNVAVNTYTINPINLTSLPNEYYSYTTLNGIIDAIPGAEGTGSGEQGTDSDSITEKAPGIQGSGIILQLAENQTVTASFNITPVSSTTPFDELCYDDEGGGGDFPLTDANLVAESKLKFGSNNEGGTIQGAVLTGGNAGEIAITGSNGFVSFFTNGNDGSPIPKIEMNESLPVSTNSFPAYLYFGGSGGQSQISGITVTGYNLTSLTFPGEGTYYTAGDAVSATSEKFVFGPAANYGTHFNKLYKSPGAITFKIKAYANRPADTPVSAQCQYRRKPSGGSFGSWTDFGSSVPIGVGSTLIQKVHTVAPTLINEGDEFEHRIEFTKSAGFGSVTISPGAKAYIIDQQNNPGFYDSIELETDVENHPISLTAGDRIKFTIDTLRGFNTYNPSDHSSGDVQITKAHTKGDTGNGILSYDGNGQDDNLEDIFVAVALYRYSAVSDDVEIYRKQYSSNTTVEEYTTIGNTGDHYFKLYLSDSSGNKVHHPGSQGFSIRQILVERWTPTTTYDTDLTFSTYENHEEFATSTNNDAATLNQSISFDYLNYIQYINLGDIPASITSISGDDITFDSAILITSSLGATASFDQGNYISGSASIDITGTKGIYIADKCQIGTTPIYPGGVVEGGYNSIGNNANSTSWQSIDTARKVRIQTKVNGTTIDTKYVDAGLTLQNIFQTEADKVQLGVLDSTDNVSFEFTVVDSSNNIDKVFKHGGFIVEDIVLKKITSSNAVTITNGDTWDSNLEFLEFDSPHVDTGDSELPFTFGGVTASIDSGQGTTTLILDNNYLTTSSFTVNATGYANGPFIISASIPFNYESGKDYFFSAAGALNQTNDGGTNEGTAVRILDADNNILSEVFNDTGTGDLSDLNFSASFASSGEGKILLFVSGATSNLYPNGIVTSSNIGFTGSYDFDGTFSANARSGSNISSGTTVSSVDFTENYASSSQLHLTSSHTINGLPGPLLTIGQQTFNIVERTDDGNIKLTTALYITASSVATGSHPTQSFVGATILAVPANPLITDSTTNESMVGGTFTYTDPDSGDTQTLTITNLTTNVDGTTDVEVNNGNGVFQVGTFEEQQPQEVTVSYSTTTPDDLTLQFKNTHLIFENEFHCTVDEDEFNFTLNPTVRKNQSINTGDLANFATGSNFKPYVTTIGLYNEAGELLVIGKMAQPIRMSDETDTTFVVRYDT